MMRDIVITGLQSWHMAIGGNIVNMAKELARQNRVLFINYAADRFTLWKEPGNEAIRKYRHVRKNPSACLEQINPNLWVFTPPVLLESVSRIKNRRIFDFFNSINMTRFGKSVDAAIREVGFKDVLLLTDSDFYRSLRLKEQLRPSVFIYYIRDNMVATSFFRHHGKRMEEAMIRKADVVVANSIFLTDYAKQYTQNAYFIGQGCDPDLFNPDSVTDIPEDIREVRKSYRFIIGYIGALRSIRIDLALLEQLAAMQPDWAFVLIGWEDEQFKKSTLHGLPNVFFFGSRSEQELPAYIHGFDVAINPQVYNELTKGNYPRKIDEYLAMGKPVVATWTEAMTMFEDVCFLGRNAEEYGQLIEEALRTDSEAFREKRIKRGREHNWANNISELFKAITACH